MAGEHPALDAAHPRDFGLGMVALLRTPASPMLAFNCGDQSLLKVWATVLNMSWGHRQGRAWLVTQPGMPRGKDSRKVKRKAHSRTGSSPQAESFPYLPLLGVRADVGCSSGAQRWQLLGLGDLCAEPINTPVSASASPTPPAAPASPAPTPPSTPRLPRCIGHLRPPRRTAAAAGHGRPALSTAYPVFFFVVPVAEPVAAARQQMELNRSLLFVGAAAVGLFAFSGMFR